MPVAAIFGGISAVAGIAGGISASNQAASNNRDAKKAAKEAKKQAKKQAKLTNEYNTKAFEAEKKDYYAQREFQWDTAVRQYQYDNSIIDYRFLQDVRMYGKSVENYKSTLAFNSVASRQAYESVQAQLGELEDQQAFVKQDLLVDRLVNQGKVATGQAGRSQIKAQQSTIAEQGRSLAMMRREFKSAVSQSEADMRDVAIQKWAADTNAKANLMLRPERAPRPLEPIQGPERTFVKPAKAIPGYTPPPVLQSTTAPLISGISSAAGSLAGINWSGLGNRQPTKPLI